MATAGYVAIVVTVVLAAVAAVDTLPASGVMLL